MNLYVQCIEQDIAYPMPAKDQVQLWARFGTGSHLMQSCELTVDQS